MGTTVLVASMRDDGQTFHESRTPRVIGLSLDFATLKGVLTVALLDVLEIEHVAELGAPKTKVSRATDHVDAQTTAKQRRTNRVGLRSTRSTTIMPSALNRMRLSFEHVYIGYSYPSVNVEIRPLLSSKHNAQLDPFHSRIPNCSPSQFIQSKPLCQDTDSKRKGSSTPVQVAYFTEHKIPIIVPNTGTSPGTVSVV